jgi:hypothetical protein
MASDISHFPTRRHAAIAELPSTALPDVLPSGLPAHPSRDRVHTIFVYLKGTNAVLAKRMAGRRGHYMKQEMLDSQLATIEEPPVKGEKGIVVVNLDQHEDQVTEDAYQGIKKFLENHE